LRPFGSELKAEGLSTGRTTLRPFGSELKAEGLSKGKPQFLSERRIVLLPSGLEAGPEANWGEALNFLFLFCQPKTINAKLLENMQSSNLRQSIIVACIMNAAYQQPK